MNKCDTEPPAREFTDKLSFSVPLPPSVNAAYPSVPRRNKQTGQFYEKRVASATLKSYKQQVWAILAELHKINAWAGCTACGYTIHIYVSRSNADASNYLKAYEDAVTSLLGFDDHFIVSGSFEKNVHTKLPRIEGTWYRYK